MGFSFSRGILDNPTSGDAAVFVEFLSAIVLQAIVLPAIVLPNFLGAPAIVYNMTS